jgi:S1-C subfamily serine protease
MTSLVTSLRFVHADSPADRGRNDQHSEPALRTDAQLLDAYSQAVIGVVEKASPAVIGVAPREGSSRGGASVQSGGPASTGGILPGDLIVAVNDRIVSSVDDLHRLLCDFPHEPPLTLTLVRRTRKLDVEVQPVIPD